MKYSYWMDDISTKNIDFLLVWLSFSTGIIDATTYAFFNVFVSNMTGNVTFLALAVSQLHMDSISAPNSVIAMVSFCVGISISGQLGHVFGDDRRWWLFTTLMAQSLLVVVAVILTSTMRFDASDTKTLGLLVPLAMSYGAQAATSRGLGITEIPTVNITGAMIDLFLDKSVFKLANRPRNRRAAFILALFAGASIGGLTARKVNCQVALAVAAAVKLVAAIEILFIPTKG
ncbi:hypothetical protein V1520DRAFT_349653 [Lipomyces starkeyi]|uniref:DUF1275 domain-containing protein n=1 Tax=Lipomyces starkeyi NRRL Y-11557 TaxID=675824 RepID=A0A1E3PU85_LIPST|nr:hypothetical protein LIPSTDRAFT_202504 [Lipomyces starkeyi NRRL Y-11557]